MDTAKNVTTECMHIVSLFCLSLQKHYYGMYAHCFVFVFQPEVTPKIRQKCWQLQPKQPVTSINKYPCLTRSMVQLMQCIASSLTASGTVPRHTAIPDPMMPAKWRHRCSSPPIMTMPQYMHILCWDVNPRSALLLFKTVWTIRFMSIQHLHSFLSSSKA